jgi:arabinose-5-phosphate isomerase
LINAEIKNIILKNMNDRQGSPILRAARQTIDIEAETLQKLAKSLGDTEDFLAVVEAVAAARGRLVVTGIGKSAIVAQKIVATLNSTGAPALFLHAADAIHGDLGMVQPEDIVLCISKSGETPEIKVLAPLVRNFGNRLVAMTANRNSTLAILADWVLWTPIDAEADPNNLAPTASTTAQMALGDALAVALLTLRGFSPGDFARFHPGGALGKQLYLRVGDLYPHHGRPAVGPDASLQEVILEISANRLGATAVLDADDRLCGIITDGDLRRMLSSPVDLLRTTAANIMTTHPRTISPDALAVEALAQMREHSITQLPVLQDQAYLGFVHLHDLLKEGIV